MPQVIVYGNTISIYVCLKNKINYKLLKPSFISNQKNLFNYNPLNSDIQEFLFKFWIIDLWCIKALMVNLYRSDSENLLLNIIKTQKKTNPLIWKTKLK